MAEGKADPSEALKALGDLGDQIEGGLEGFLMMADTQPRTLKPNVWPSSRLTAAGNQAAADLAEKIIACKATIEAETKQLAELQEQEDSYVEWLEEAQQQGLEDDQQSKKKTMDSLKTARARNQR